jgi:hypothetical protein
MGKNAKSVLVGGGGGVWEEDFLFFLVIFPSKF